MAKKEELQRHFNQNRIRNFSETFKREMVSRIENNLSSVYDISKEYGVSRTAVYKWVYTYSRLYKKGYRQIVEPMSDNKKIQRLKDKVKELEHLIGQKQIELEFKEKMIELAEKRYGIDIKKKSSSTPSGGSGNTGKNTAGA